MLNSNNPFTIDLCFCRIVSYTDFSDFVALPLISARLNALTKTWGWLIQARNMGLNASSIIELGAKKAIQYDLHEEHVSLWRFFFRIDSRFNEIHFVREPNIKDEGFVTALEEQPLENVSVKQIRTNEKTILKYSLGLFEKEDHLDLTSYEFARIPKTPFPFPNVKKVTTICQQDCLHPLPKWIFQLPKLKVLELSNFAFTIPENISCSSQLEKLDMDNGIYFGESFCVGDTKPFNRINELPKILTTLTLKTLNLINLKLTAFPIGICQLSSLTNLDLTQNPLLGKLPSEIAQLQNLEHLLLANTGLTTWPKEVFELKRIKFLDISKNHIWNIEEEVVAWFKRSRVTLLSIEVYGQTSSWSSTAKLILNSYKNSHLLKIEQFPPNSIDWYYR